MIESGDCGISGIQLCSSFCFSGTRDPVRVFSNITEFLNEQENADKVIILQLKVYDQSLLRLFNDVFAEATELRSLMYTHPGIGAEWPLLDELIDANKRLIIFKHGDDLDCNIQYTCPQGAHNTFDYMFGTPIDLEGTDQLFDYDISCTIQQGSNSSDFFMLNHYANGAFGKADAGMAQVEKFLSNIRKRLIACRNKFERDPRLLVVDYWNIGGALDMVDERSTCLANDSGSGRQ